MTIRPGEVYRADLGLGAKVRPVLIVSREDPQRPRDLVLGVPLTTQNRGSRHEVVMPRVRFLRDVSVANLQGLQPFRPAELEGPIGRFEPSALTAIREGLRWVLEV